MSRTINATNKRKTIAEEAIMNWYLIEETGLVYKPLTILILRKIQPKSK